MVEKLVGGEQELEFGVPPTACYIAWVADPVLKA